MKNNVIISLSTLILLSSCSTPSMMQESSVPVTKEAVAHRKENTKKVSAWEISGAIAAKNRVKGWSASMNWVQNSINSYQIRLMGPLGAGTVLISKQGGTVTFQDGPKKISSHNADQLLLQQTGIQLPVNNLYYWIRGLPAPGAISAEKHDKLNHLVQLQQAGYTIEYSNFSSVNDTELPRNVRLTGNGLMIKVVIKSWKV